MIPWLMKPYQIFRHVAEPVKEDDIFFTMTMASVLEEQGHMEDALVIYKILLAATPGDRSLGEKIDTLKAMAGKRRPPRSVSERG